MLLLDIFGCTLTSGKNLSSCVRDLISTQDGYVEYNENALELAIEQGKMAFEKAYYRGFINKLMNQLNVL